MNKFKNIAIIFGLFALLFASCFEKDEPKRRNAKNNHNVLNFNQLIIDKYRF